MAKNKDQQSAPDIFTSGVPIPAKWADEYPPGVLRSLSAPEIEHRAAHHLRGTNTDGLEWSTAAFASVGCLPVLGCLSLMIPVVGVAICIALWGLTIGLIAFSGGSLLYSFIRPGNKHQVAGLAYRWRGMQEGKCPICEAVILIIPTRNKQLVDCPACENSLLYDMHTLEPN